MNKRGFPVIRATMLKPVLSELRKRGLDEYLVLEKLGVDPKTIENPENFLPPDIAYQCLNIASKIANDPYFGARLGAQLDATVWSNLSSFRSSTSNVASQLTHFIEITSSDVTTTNYTLKISHEGAIFDILRTFQSPVEVHQANAHSLAEVVTMIKSLVFNIWDPAFVLCRISDPSIVPPDIMPQGCLLIGDINKVSIKFPASWLTIAIDSEFIQPKQENSLPAVSLIGSLDQIFDSFDFSVKPKIKEIARITGTNSRQLQRELAKQNTTFSTVVENSMRRFAIDKLENSNMSVTEIALSLGFSNPANFSRAFRVWTDQSPSSIRKKHGQYKIR